MPLTLPPTSVSPGGINKQNLTRRTKAAIGRRREEVGMWETTSAHSHKYWGLQTAGNGGGGPWVQVRKKERLLSATPD